MQQHSTKRRNTGLHPEGLPFHPIFSNQLSHHLFAPKTGIVSAQLPAFYSNALLHFSFKGERTSSFNGLLHTIPLLYIAICI